MPKNTPVKRPKNISNKRMCILLRYSSPRQKSQIEGHQENIEGSVDVRRMHVRRDMLRTDLNEEKHRPGHAGQIWGKLQRAVRALRCREAAPLVSSSTTQNGIELPVARAVASLTTTPPNCLQSRWETPEARFPRAIRLTWGETSCTPGHDTGQFLRWEPSITTGSWPCGRSVTWEPADSLHGLCSRFDRRFAVWFGRVGSMSNFVDGLPRGCTMGPENNVRK